MNKILVASLLPFLLIACAKPTEFDYLGVDNVKVLKFGLKESTVSLDVKYYNPNHFPLVMKRANVDVYVNKNYFGKTLLDSTIHIPRRDTFYLPVLLTVDMARTGMNILQTLGAGSDSVLVKLNGEARVGRSGIFINYPIRYEGLQKIRF